MGVLRAAVAGLGLLLATAAGAAERAVAAGPPVRLQMTEEGPIYAAPSGMTLYIWDRDKGTPGVSQCRDKRYDADIDNAYGITPIPAAQARKTCAQKWPPFLAAADAKPDGRWSITVREDGARQWAWDGFPVYSSRKDVKPGDVNGQPRIGGGTGRSVDELDTFFHPIIVWRDLLPGLKVVRREEGLVLFLANDRPLFVRKGPERPCGAGCVGDWQPYRAPQVAQVGGDWSVVDAGGGVRQYAFRGKRLYTPPDDYSGIQLAAQTDWTPAVVRPATPLPAQIKVRLSVMGRVYATESGMSLYAFNCNDRAPDHLACDDPGDAAAYRSTLCGDARECARRWRPYPAKPGARPGGEWTIIEVADPPFAEATSTTYPPGPRIRAWAYRGRPVYTFVDDDEPGQIRGHGVRWNGHSGFFALPVPGQIGEVMG